MDVNHPGSQKDVVSSWEPAHSLVEDADPGAKIEAALCLLALAVGCLPSASGDGGPYMAAGLLSFGICSILCSVSVPGVLIEPFVTKVSFVCLSGDPTVWVAVSH